MDADTWFVFALCAGFWMFIVAESPASKAMLGAVAIVCLVFAGLDGYGVLPAWEG